MSSDLNRVMIIGRLVRDPELRYTQSGTAVCNFSIANGRKFKDNEETSFFSVIAWGKLGELICQYQKKGLLIGIEGRLQQRSWENDKGEKRSTVEIVAENAQFLTPRDSDAQEMPPSAPVNNNPFSVDDVPF
jgi:single-strand DNA-binding protein